MRLLIMGRSGAGKGTQAPCIATHYGIPAISTGDDLPREREAEDRRWACRWKRSWRPVTTFRTRLTEQIVADRLDQHDAQSRLPARRLPPHAAPGQALDDSSPSTAPAGRRALADRRHEALIQRLLKRAEIEGRADDTEETIRHRMEVYQRGHRPLIDDYRDRGLLIEVDGDGEIDEVSERIFAALSGVADAR